MNFKRLLEIPKGRLIKKIFGYDEIYTIALRCCDDKSLPEGNTQKPFAPISYSEKYWYADPLLFSWQGRDYLFVEEFDRKKSKGQIAVAEVVDLSKRMVFKSIIAEPYHMSFPMVFEWNGEIYMIPETSANHSINIYHADSFPYEWKLLSSIKTQQPLVDTIVVEKNSEYVTILSSEINKANPLEVKYQKFRLFYSNLKELIPDNVFNFAQTFNLEDRNAGGLIESDYCILPTQYSSLIDYGVKLSFRNISNQNNRIDVSHNELNILDVNKKNIIGIHTYSKGEKVETIDVRYLKFDPIKQYSKLLMKR